jgi:YD repeat-containing protein
MRALALASCSIILVLAALSCSLLARAETTTYTYDALGHLIQVNGSANGSVATYTYDAAGNRTQTTSKSESIAPSVPTGLGATAVSQTQINLSWSASTDTGGSGLAGYKIYRGGSQVGTSPTTSYSDSSLAAGTTYSYKVAAYDVAGNVSAQSSAASATTLDTTAPSVPTGLNGSAASATQINLTWNASTDNVGVTGYRVYRGGSQIGTSATTAYTDSTVVGSTTYSYTVAAYDAATNVSAQSSPKSVSTPDVTPPSTPTNLSATAASPSRINLSWSASTDTGGSGLAGYRVYRNGGGTPIATVATTSYSDTNLAASTAYSYTVRAYDNATNTSGQSNTASATTWPAVVASLSTTAWQWIKRGTNAPQIDPPVVCTGSGGSGSGYTYAWQWVSGDTQTSAVSPTSSSTRWSRTVPTNINATYTSVWRCLVTDSGGNTGQKNVTVSFTMNTTQFAP